jgi:hypothetical protein
MKTPPLSATALRPVAVRNLWQTSTTMPAIDE